MSSSALYRNPTWISLFPRTPTPVAAPRELARRLAPHLPGPGTLHRLDYAGRPSTHFVFKGDDVFAGDDGERLFLKLVGEGSADRQREADEISAWLATRGVSCVAPAAGFPRPLEGDTWLFAYPYYDCEPLTPDAADVARLGEELAELHGALARHPARATWDWQSLGLGLIDAEGSVYAVGPGGLARRTGEPRTSLDRETILDVTDQGDKLVVATDAGVRYYSGTERGWVAGPDPGPVSYTHLTLPTNREV